MSLSEFKDVNAGKSAILFATGPSLNQFNYSVIPEKPEELVKVGVNSIIYKDDLELDYWFGAQNVANEEGHAHAELEKEYPILEKIIERSADTEIFCAINTHEGFSSEELCSMSANTYLLSPQAAFRTDVHAASQKPSSGLYNHSIVFPALQFLLYTGVSKIYLVGCDCGGGNSFINTDVAWGEDRVLIFLLEHWGVFRSFVEAQYPNVKIISINPRGLKGFFDEDIYTDE